MFLFVLSVLLYVGLLLAILFEQYVVSLVLLGFTLLLGIKVVMNIRKDANMKNITLVPANKIKILGIPMTEVSSTEIEWETKGETVNEKEFHTEFDI